MVECSALQSHLQSLFACVRCTAFAIATVYVVEGSKSELRTVRPRSKLDLTRYVFNTEAHPMGILRTHRGVRSRGERGRESSNSDRPAPPRCQGRRGVVGRSSFEPSLLRTSLLRKPSAGPWAFGSHLQELASPPIDRSTSGVSCPQPLVLSGGTNPHKHKTNSKVYENTGNPGRGWEKEILENT